MIKKELEIIADFLEEMGFTMITLQDSSSEDEGSDVRQIDNGSNDHERGVSHHDSNGVWIAIPTGTSTNLKLE